MIAEARVRGLSITPAVNTGGPSTSARSKVIAQRVLEAQAQEQ